MIVERVRCDGNWIVGDPGDRRGGSWRIDGRSVTFPARMICYHHTAGAPLPDFPGWVTPRFGFACGPGTVFMEYVAAPEQAPEQLELFDVPATS